MPDIKQSKILIMATDGFEQSELLVPLQKLKQAGATVHVATPEKKPIKGWDQKDWGERRSPPIGPSVTCPSKTMTRWVLPGGQINPDVLRTNQKAVQLVKDFEAAGKVVAAICHGPWMLVEARLASGRTMTSYHSIKTDVENAGATWVDKEVVTDRGIHHQPQAR